jgi:hypothetical protein
MKKIPLTQGKYALVDDEDFEELSQFKWYAWKSKNRWYARRNYLVSEGGRQRGAGVMHRQLMQVQNPLVQVDHKDHNGLNNQKDNLRVCKNAENCRNKPKGKRKLTCRYKGVHLKIYPNGTKRWIAQICVAKKKIHLACCKTQKEAAFKYNKGALKYHRDYASINKI